MNKMEEKIGIPQNQNQNNNKNKNKNKSHNQAQSQNQITVALAGNPNSGKTSLFNELTGARQHVGNWPGVTVEKKEGELFIEGKTVKVVDLPGTYSLGAYSEDESIARDFIIYEKPDVVINIVDASNLERNLYLTVQLLEMGANVVVALNMYDEAIAKQIEINMDALSKLLNVPVIPTIAPRGKGIKELMQQVLERAVEGGKGSISINYGKEVENALELLQKELLQNETGTSPAKEKNKEFNARWQAIKLLEGDDSIIKMLSVKENLEKLNAMRDKAVNNIESILGEDIESIIAEKKYSFIGDIIKKSVKKNSPEEEKLSVSDRIDVVLTNKYVGIPIFLIVMWAVFQFTFKLGDPLIGWIEAFFELFGDTAGSLLEGIGAPQLIVSLAVDGIIRGIGSILVFIPNIFLLFFAISLLEDSGYMSRAAYIVDRLMHALGLHGKAFIPMIIGFGCNVPAIMATRTLENKKDRLITILISPLISCSARLPVYVLFTAAFFSKNQGIVIFSLYMLGIVLAIIMGMIFKRFLFKGETSHFIMELPPYRIPTIKSTFIHMWERGGAFIKKAGSIIFSVMIFIWILSNLPAGVEYASRESILGKIGSFIAPVLKPAGFGKWNAAVALMFGILAKEVVVGTLGVIHGVGEEGLIATIAQTWTALSAYSFMVMTLTYIPCAAVIGIIKRETNSWGWTFFAVGYTLALGWLMAVLVFQGGKLIGLG